MAKKGHSEPGLFGSINHYDEHGKKIGHSDPGLFGGYNHYDSKGHKTGHSDPGLFGGYNHYDSHGKKRAFCSELLLMARIQVVSHCNFNISPIKSARETSSTTAQQPTIRQGANA